LKYDFDVCFVGLKCYDLLSGAAVPRFLGGVEKQLVALAEGMVEGGLRVAFITYDHGQQDIEQHKGISVFKSFSQDAGLPVVRFFHPRMTRIWSTMKKVNARVFVQMGSGSETGQVASGCRYFTHQPASFLFCVASDADCSPDLPFLPVLREKILYRYGLRASDAIVAQSHKQQQMLQDTFSLDSKVIPMPFNGPDESTYVAPAPPGPGVISVLWVGRIIDVKRLEWLLDMAEACPDYQFDVVGTPNQESDYSQGLYDRAAGIKNVTLHGRVGEKELPGFFKRASVLCCTSIIEGFPTTFMEAWSYGLPIVTSFDPDNMIARNELGFVDGTVDGLVKALNSLFSDSELWQQFSTRARQYYLQNHTLGAVTPRFIKVMENIGR